MHIFFGVKRPPPSPPVLTTHRINAAGAREFIAIPREGGNASLPHYLYCNNSHVINNELGKWRDRSALVYADDEYTHINSHSAPEMRNNNGAAKRNSGMGTILNTTHSKMLIRT